MKMRLDDGVEIELDDYQTDMIEWCCHAARAFVCAFAAGTLLVAIASAQPLYAAALWIIGLNSLICFVFLLSATSAGLNGKEWLLWMFSSATVFAVGYFFETLTSGGWQNLLVLASLVALTFYVSTFEVYIHLAIPLIRWLVPKSTRDGVRYFRKSPPPGPRMAAVALFLPPRKDTYTVTLEPHGSDGAATVVAVPASAVSTSRYRVAGD